MKEINRLITNICSDNLQKSRIFYTTLFSFQVAFDSDWYIQLVAKDKNLELGIISRQSELIPVEFQQKPQGVYLSFVVDQAEEIYEKALTEKFEIVEKPADTFYGQRRLLLKDPDGTLVDVSSIIQ